VHSHVRDRRRHKSDCQYCTCIAENSAVAITGRRVCHTPIKVEVLESCMRECTQPRKSKMGLQWYQKLVNCVTNKATSLSGVAVMIMKRRSIGNITLSYSPLWQRLVVHSKVKCIVLQFSTSCCQMASISFRLLQKTLWPLITMRVSPVAKP